MVMGALWLRPWLQERLPERATASRSLDSSRFGTSFDAACRRGVVDPESLRRLKAMQARREKLDETVWADEILAEKYGQGIVDLWDALRRKEDAYEVMRNFSFRELLLAAPGPSRQCAHQISIRQTAGPAHAVTAKEWPKLLEHFQTNDFRLDQSEWRLTQFDRGSSESGARGVVEMSLQVRQETTGRRFIVEGDLEVQWEPPSMPDSIPPIDVIDATQLELRERLGGSVFRRVFHRVIAPDPATGMIDPLIVYDLEGDGPAEIILPAKNLVFRNRGDMKFTPGRLLEHHDHRARQKNRHAEHHFENQSHHSPPSLLAAMICDIDGSGSADLLAADSEGLLVWEGTPDGRFLSPPHRVWKVPDDRLYNVFGFTAADVDGDGDLDVWLGQYKKPYVAGQMPTPYYDANDGFPAFLLRQDSDGRFHDATAAAGLMEKRFRRNYSASLVDLDQDGDFDLVTSSDFCGVEIFLNTGDGTFVDRTAEWIDQPRLFGMSHTFGDFDRDGRRDLLVMGMTSSAARRLEHMDLGRKEFPHYQSMRSVMDYGNRLYFGGPHGFMQSAISRQVADTGWAWGSVAMDFDNDADEDLYVVNGHQTRASAKEYDAQFWMHDIYLGGSRHDPVLDMFFQSEAEARYGAGESYGGHNFNQLFINEEGRGFHEAAYLMGIALPSDYRNVVAHDFDLDGRMDLVMTTMQVWPRRQQELEIYQNLTADPGLWIGFHFAESDPHHSPLGAQIRLQAGGQWQQRDLVLGEGYRSQRPWSVHFGLGRLTPVETVEILWAHAESTRIDHPQPNQWHFVPAPVAATPHPVTVNAQLNSAQR